MGSPKRSGDRDPATIVACMEQAQRILLRSTVTSMSLRAHVLILQKGTVAFADFEKAALQLFSSERVSVQRMLHELRRRMRRTARQYPRPARLRSSEIVIVQPHWRALRTYAHEARREFLLASDRLHDAIARQKELDLDADDLELFATLRGRLAAAGKYREQIPEDVSLSSMWSFLRSFEDELVTGILFTRYIFDGIPLDA